MSQRKQHWDNIYSEKLSIEVSWYQKKPEVSLSLIEKCGVDKNAPIIDIGGGASHLVDYLLRMGYRQLMVLDISGKSLQIARQRLANDADKIIWLESDITEFIAPTQVALWHDRAVFHFLTTATERKKYLDVLAHTLKPNGYVIIAAFALDGPQQCSGLDIVQYDAGKLLAEFGEGYRLLEQQGELHVTPSNTQQHFQYYWLQKRF